MNRLEIETEIRSALAHVVDADVSDIPIDCDLIEEFGLDSLSRLELLSEVEDRFDLIIYDADTAKASTILGMLEICEAAIAQNAVAV